MPTIPRTRLARTTPATNAALWIFAAKAIVLAAALLVGGFGILATLVGAGVLAAPAGCDSASVLKVDSRFVPRALVPIYERAAARYRLGTRGPAILAAINKVESGFGRDLSTSSAGAVGWMQFEPSTWALYGLDANADGTADPRDRWDAIFAAARYLHASGAPENWRGAVFAYNHAAWYVDEVLALAARVARSPGSPRLEANSTDAGAGRACEETGGRLRRILAEAARMDSLRARYVYGGGHVTPAPATPPWDCSATWSRLMQTAGYRIATMTSSGFMAWGDPGPGRSVTIYATPDHVYGTISGRPFGTSSPGGNPRNPGGGPAWLPYRVNPVPNFPGGRPTVRHPPGL